MRTLIDGGVHPHAAATRIVWLPGAYQAAQDFQTAGFTAAATRRGLSVELVYVDLDLEHLNDRTILQRLHSELLLPAHEAGRRCWLAGISLGGMLALDYAATYPE